MDGAEGAEIAVSRKQTTIERERNKRALAAHEFLTHIPENPEELPTVTSYMPPTLKDAIFCGHLVTDLDSIAGAIGAAELYGGYPARASEINSETRFAIDMWGVDVPMPIEQALTVYEDSGVCLVDHQQTSQLNKAISVERIVGVIDHHALQNSTIVTDMPIYIDIRPWGSMSTIITHSFLVNKRRPTRKTAGMLLCAILSDTLNLQGPTTTEWDRLMVAVLVEIVGVDDVQFLASQQFKAKSAELAGLSAAELVNGDQKVGCAHSFPPIPFGPSPLILSLSPSLPLSLSLPHSLNPIGLHLQDGEVRRQRGLRRHRDDGRRGDHEPPGGPARRPQ